MFIAALRADPEAGNRDGPSMGKAYRGIITELLSARFARS
jgi:hypothetical protein